MCEHSVVDPSCFCDYPVAKTVVEEHFRIWTWGKRFRVEAETSLAKEVLAAVVLEAGCDVWYTLGMEMRRRTA